MCWILAEELRMSNIIKFYRILRDQFLTKTYLWPSTPFCWFGSLWLLFGTKTKNSIATRNVPETEVSKLDYCISKVNLTLVSWALSTFIPGYQGRITYGCILRIKSTNVDLIRKSTLMIDLRIHIKYL